MSRSPITAQHLLALANPPAALDLVIHLIERHGSRLDPRTQRPAMCGWSLDQLYTACVAAAKMEATMAPSATGDPRTA